ncbi:collagen alpha-1(I) chain-like isoform X3 [Falco biarmicus]|uniref:collagen alpha-1(I) chain-like isoform X3 n=1 Tax=Falco biarmicus TaxID=345155 RepID=UPI0024BD3A48|nr:collagen alpha-1(I) chain-like isoform X3 [Falco biarmicus]
MPGARGDGNRHRGGRSLRRPVRPTARRLPEPERAVPRGSLPLQQGGRRPRSPRLPDGGKTQRLGRGDAVASRALGSPLHGTTLQRGTVAQAEKPTGRTGFGACGCHPERGHRGGPGPGVRPAGARGCPPELAALLPARRPGCPGARVTPPSATRGI